MTCPPRALVRICSLNQEPEDRFSGKGQNSPNSMRDYVFFRIASSRSARSDSTRRCRVTAGSAAAMCIISK